MKIKKTLLSLALLACLCTGSALAADWYYLGTSSSGDTYYVDNSSVEKNDDTAIIWEKITDKKGSSWVQQVIVSRKNRTSALVKRYIVEPDGKVYQNFSAKSKSDLDFYSIRPESSSEIFYNSIWPNKADMSSNRWYYLGNEGDTTYYIDNSTVQKDSNTAIVWVKEMNSHGDCYIQQCLLKRRDQTIKILDLTYVQANGYTDYEGGRQNSESIWSQPFYQKIYYAIWSN
ncbi:hypothetical protein [Megasphaera hominis]|uniref:Uncharacterized protein n=1 Tax=Megasphaera hominis TaxID=159836 RepID=A0ABR6VL27_9FIRM|nr:hypothetical protein [Megasphaera hominis]MBC3537978.1 hypothetical protein [Megasphaera hominis]